ncbi:MAG: KTSC domain-containing protein [Candidatus Gracilibacteria bacterium]|nr:KTSC domain-containing protein [Candidatus Gracilibacteria bacterium]
MRRESVYSSNIISIGYDPERQLLEIEFHGGGIYQYIGVPHHIYNALMSAPSHGVYFAQNIRLKYQMVTE